MIYICYSSVDGYVEERKYKSLGAAQQFAQKWVGETPELGTYYAISGDGIGKITVEGIELKHLFPLLIPR